MEIIDNEREGQRLDNYLLGKYRNLSRSNIYKIIRSGQVRINSKRVKPLVRLKEGDNLRLPPWLEAPVKELAHISLSRSKWLLEHIVYEDKSCLVIDKPQGLAVHAGGGCKFGLIELLRVALDSQVELVHRLDKLTSGLLLIAKTRSALLNLQQQLRANNFTKIYSAVVAGEFPKKLTKIDKPLKRLTNESSNQAQVVVAFDGKPACTLIQNIDKLATREFGDLSILTLKLISGRTHQIRVHLSSSDHPIIGDKQYFGADFSRMCLHAEQLEFVSPTDGQKHKIVSSIDWKGLFNEN